MIYNFQEEKEIREWENTNKIIYHFCRKHGIYELSKNYQDTSLLIQLYNFVYKIADTFNTLPRNVVERCLLDKRFQDVLKDMKDSNIMEA